MFLDILIVVGSIEMIGQIQQGNSEYLMMLIEVLNKGSVPYCGSDDNISTGSLYLKAYFNFC